MNIQKLMQQAKKMQEDAQRMEKELSEKVYTASAGGVVSVAIKGDYTIDSIQLEDDVLNDKEMLIELLTLALQDSLNKINDDKNKQMADITGGIKLPGGF